MQWKQVCRLLPKAVCAALILFGALALVLQGLVKLDGQREDQQKVSIALCGIVEDSFLEFGLNALKSMDDIRFSLEVSEMEEPEAILALERGEITAYVVIPEGFLSEAMHGRLHALRFVSTAGAGGLDAVFKEEITQVIGDILLAAQQGTYGTYDALSDHGQPEKGYDLMNAISYEYVELAFQRGDASHVTVLGVGSHVGLSEYLTGGLAVLFLLLSCLSFAPVMVRRDLSLERMLAAKGNPGFLQGLCGFFACFGGLTALFAIVFSLLNAAGWLWGNGLLLPWTLLAQSVPVIFLAASLSFLLAVLVSDLLSGILLQFLTVLALCFVSGCLYPVSFFPETVQKLAGFLPTGIAREYLTRCMAGVPSPGSPLALLGFGCAFVALSCIIRRQKIVYRRR